ncbi:MAG: D-alanyl-D-alanine carboxypeptidase [Silicimonas sp.]|nr:D-alanyl-D-alanine carboxypeptidase [Silicimonas sp.]NND41105.1 D-alanyl-D-alanine carboxypeptidase [Silicimonas sp.]NNF92476.1 D-alanyl-D-alanine carboxypeptidase [Boseongicola sp.]RZW06159.1 MAG: D-alanyl-D-alanine carboxypeptidase [Paracoccaceae bacterium]
MVIDARSGEVLHSRNADTRLHPASLTKMMTLYVVFDAIERGELSLDTRITISKKAAAEPPSKLGLKAGQKIAVRHLIRAAAVKSANDAATALGEAVSGSEAAFARRMNRTALAMGMTRTTFRNAHGLTESGHLSTARDMTRLGRHLFYDFPDYYNLFSRNATNAGGKTVYNTNRRLLGSYRGADGIKTGYTRAAGFNLVASAERGSERIIATVFGGRSVATRNAHVAELLDMGFNRAPSRVAVNKPARPVLVAANDAADPGKTIRTSGLISRSPRPATRPVAAPADEVLVAMADGIADALAEVAVADTPRDAVPAAPPEVLAASLAGALLRPAPRPLIEEGSAPDLEAPEGPTVVTRLSTSGGRHWGVNVGRFTTRHEAEKVLLQTALVEMSTLDEALRKVVRSPKGWEANFVGMSREQADLACRRLAAQNVDCSPMGPG